ncbi:hypothetical protein [Micromonospora sp. DT47]
MPSIQDRDEVGADARARQRQVTQHELAVDASPASRVAAAFTELAQVI